MLACVDENLGAGAGSQGWSGSYCCGPADSWQGLDVGGDGGAGREVAAS